MALNKDDDDEEGRDEDDEDSDEESDEDDLEGSDEDSADTQAKRLLNGEIADLEKAVQRREAEMANTANPLIRRRLEDAPRKMRAELDAKRLQRTRLVEGPQEDGGGDDGRRRERRRRGRWGRA